MSQENDVIIRAARAEDIDVVLEKILELARFEYMEDQCKMTSEKLLKDGGFLSSNDPKHYGLLVAEAKIDGKSQLVGYAMWYYVSFVISKKAFLSLCSLKFTEIYSYRF